jgi:hypothetical protein
MDTLLDALTRTVLTAVVLAAKVAVVGLGLGLELAAHVRGER